MRRRVLFAWGAVLAAALAAAGPAFARSAAPVGADLFSNPYEIAEKEDVAYVLYPSGLAVLDIRSALRPSLISSVFLPGEAGGLLLRENYLYVSRGTGGLFTMSLDDPFRPAVVDTLPAPSSFGRLDHGWNRLQVADRDSGLIVIDIQNPGAPQRLYKYPIGEPIQDIRVRRAVASLALERGGLRTFDISHYIPVPLAHRPELAGAAHLDFSFATLYVSRGGDGISAVDVSDSTNPVILPDAYRPSGATGDVAAVDSFLVAVHDARELHLLRRGGLSAGALAVSAVDTTLGRVLAKEGRVYSTGLDRGLRLVELVIPQNATYVAGFAVPGAVVSDVAVEGDTAFLAAGAKGVGLVSLTDELNPALLGFLPTVGSVNALEVNDRYIYAAETGQGLRVYDAASGAAVGFASTPGTQGLLVDESLAYMCGGSAGLSILDVSNPAGPVPVGSIGTGGAAGRSTRAVAVFGNLVALAEGDAGIRLADAANPAAPAVLGAYDPADYVIDVAFSETGVLYALLRSTGLLVLDVADPARPDSVGLVTISGSLLRNVKKLGSVLYVTESLGVIDPGFVHVISVADPRVPRVLLRIQSQGFPGNLATGRERAYVAAGSGGFEIFGTFEDYGFLPIGSYDPHAPIDIASASETRVLATDREGKIWPFYLQEGEALSRGEPYDLGRAAADVVLHGTRAFASIAGESLLVELTLPTPDIALLARTIELPGEASGLAIRDTLLCVAMKNHGFGVYSIARPEAVAPLGFFRSGGTENSDLAGAGAERIALGGNLAFVGTADRSRGLFILDLVDPSAPVFRSMFPTTHRVLDVAAYAGHVYLGQRQIGTTIVNAENPDNPTQSILRPDLSFVRRMRVVNDHLFCARRTEGIDVYDLANPANPVRVWRGRTPETAFDLAVFGTYLAEADGSAFRMYRQDFVNADQTAPSYTIGILSNPFANAFLDFVIVSSEALIEKPEVRFTMGEVDTSLAVFRIDVARNVYRAVYRLAETGIGTVSVSGEDLAGNKSDTSKEFSVSYVRGSKGGSIYSPSGKVEVRIPPRESAGDSYVLLTKVERSEIESETSCPLPAPALGPFRLSLGEADGPVAVFVRDVPLDPEGNAPSLFRMEGDAWILSASEHDAARGSLRGALPGSSVFLLSHEASAPAPALPALRLEPNRPNPFNPNTTLVFFLSKEVRARLSIYDLSGRLVRHLADGVFPAGSHAVAWNGTDSSGRRAASGVYFARVEAAGLSETRKIVLLK